MTGQVPPNDLGAERALLGAALLRPEAFDAATEAGVTDADFYRPAHGHVWAAMVGLHTRGDAIDVISLRAALEAKGLLEAAGGEADLVGLLSAPPATSNAARYAAIVTQMSLLRRLAAVGRDITELAMDAKSDPHEALEAAEAAVFSLTLTRHRRRAQRLGETLTEWSEIMEARAHPDARGVTTGLVELDLLLYGLRPGQLITIAARPGCGKSLLGGHLAVACAEAAGPALMVSIEMSTEELEDRFVAARSGIPLSFIRRGEVGDRDAWRVGNAVGELAGLPIWIYDDPAATLAAIRSQVRRVASKDGKPALVIVDYLQLMTSQGRAENRQVEVAELSRGLKQLAREMQLPVVALAQLNRGVEMRHDKRPMLADLRESGAIENDSDVVVFIYRDELYHPETRDKDVAELIVAKQRNGPTGTAKVGYIGAQGRFVNLTTTQGEH